MSTNRTMKPVTIEPRLAGERNPSAANMIVDTDIQKIWTPVPMSTENRIGLGGGRKTSPCTSFQPLSSCSSAFSSSVGIRL